MHFQEGKFYFLSLQQKFLALSVSKGYMKTILNWPKKFSM